MTSYTYPMPRPSGTLSTAQIQLLLSRPGIIAKRVATLVDQRFIADYLLQGRFDAVGGGVFYETGEEIFAADSAEAIAALGEYPTTVLTSGDLAAAKTVKWGLGSKISDERIARLGINTVNRALSKLGNTVTKNVDSVAMAVINSKVTDTLASAATWTTAGKMVAALETARSGREDLALGVDPDTVVLTGAQYAQVLGMLVDANALPREAAGNPILTGQFPIQALGFTWVTSPWWTSANPMLVDREQLGGMGDEDLGSPGYAKSAGIGGVGVEVQSIRLAENDGWKLQARRVTVPVVLEPHAGVKITGTGL